MYEDDAVIYTPTKNTQEAACILATVMTYIQDWLMKSCLPLNTRKTVCMVFSKSSVKTTHSNVFLGGEELEFAKGFKYLGVTLDSSLTLKNHIKKTANTIKFIYLTSNRSGHRCQ